MARLAASFILKTAFLNLCPPHTERFTVISSPVEFRPTLVPWLCGEIGRGASRLD